MSSLRVNPHLAVLTRHALTGLLATVVFALGLLGSAPSAHDWLHAHDATHAVPHDDAGCAVTLFAHGTTTPLELPRIVSPHALFLGALYPEPSCLLLTAEHHLTPPGRGPPCIG